MKTPTAQPRDNQTAGQTLIRATRFLADRHSGQQLPGDVALDTRWLGRDLVREVFQGRPANQTDGKYVDVVTQGGKRLRVITRVVVTNTQNKLVAKASATELSVIGFAADDDRPDSVMLVAVHPDRNTVDILEFPLEVDARVGKKPASMPVVQASWSIKNRNYGKHQAKLTYSYKAN
jgi:hypothetical protein